MTIVALILGGMVLDYISVSALNYGEGTYGSCQYDTCSITLAVSSPVTLNITPSGSNTTCSIANGGAQVSTRSSTGYTLLFSNTDAITALTGITNGGSIPAVGGSLALPVLLTSNSWGYRIDGGAFGPGPTTAVTDVAIPLLTFAAIPPKIAPDTITYTEEPATEQTTTVWYGVCVDLSKPADTYTDTVEYTAVIN